MIRFFLFLSVFIVSAGSADAFSRGPVPYRNQFPLALLFFSFGSDSAYIEDSSSMRSEISYSSVFERGGGDVPDYFIDMEVARTRVSLKGRVSAALLVEGELTYVRVGPGFLDSSIRAYHSLLGVRVGSSGFPDNAYTYSVNGNGIHLDFPRPGSSFSDTALKIKWNILKEASWYPAISFKGALKLPTGRRNTFAGSGSTDLGVSFLASKRAGRVVFHLNLSSIRVFSSGLRNTVNDPVFYQGMVGIEWLPGNSFSILLQAQSHKYPFSNTGISGLDNLALEEVIGFKYVFSGFQIDVAFIEDTSDINFSPDFSTLFAVTFFGQREVTNRSL